MKKFDAMLRWLHPPLDDEGPAEELRAFFDDQAVTSLKLLATIFFLLAVASQVILYSIHTSVEHGTLLGLVFISLTCFLGIILLVPFKRRIARPVLLLVMCYLIAQNVYFELATFRAHQIQFGLFIAAVCFIGFTFLPYRPWVVAAFGVFSILSVVATCYHAGVTMNFREDTTVLWLCLELTALTAITVAFRGAIFNLHLRIRRSNRELSVAREEMRDLKSLLARAEGQHVEYKSSLRWDENRQTANAALEQVIVKSIAGFLNSEGGTLIIGVDDRGKVTGIERDMGSLKRRDRDGFEQAVVQLVSERIGPEACPHIRISFVEVEEKTVCLAHIRPSPRPVYVKVQSESQFFLRTGNSTRQLDTRQAIEFIQTRWK